MQHHPLLFILIVIIVNGTIESKIVNATQHVFVPALSIAIKTLSQSEANCDCRSWKGTDNQNLLDCQCAGGELKEIPQHLNESLGKLSVADAHNMKILRRNALDKYRPSLVDIALENLPELQAIEDGSFANIPNLRTLCILNAPQIKFLSGLLMGANPKNFLIMQISNTGLLEIPDLAYLPEDNQLHLLSLEKNKIRKIASNSMKIVAEEVRLNENEISIVEDLAFNGAQISRLKLRNNTSLVELQAGAFKGLQSLKKLDLSGTSISHLPFEGLGELEYLLIEGTPSLETIPSIYDIQHLKEARLTHSFHCCAFKYPEQHNPQRYAQYHETIRKCENTAGQTPPLKQRPTRSNSFEYKPLNKSQILAPLRGHLIEHQDAQPTSSEDDDEIFHETSIEIINKQVTALCGKFANRTFNVKCSPEPNALNPCEDIMGFYWLRVAVWFVVVLAVVGNLAVIIVVLCSTGGLTVTKFLISNLAFADFCMGLYLLLIASMDLHSVGSYFNSAFRWQYGSGCQIAGFLTIFASHLSVFTLTVVTLERWFAITYAIHLTKRIGLESAVVIMFGGWVYSIVLAALPLFGVSNYSSTSICLPMEINCFTDKAYLFSIIFTNAIAFALIVFCYAHIYLSLGQETRRGRSGSGEMTIAKKMALLIFTDFATWAPISFFSITALAGYPLIGVTKSKILLVFFYPINSCANPYLYAIMTAQYRRDFFVLLAKCGICKKMSRKYTLPTNHPNSLPLLRNVVEKNGNGILKAMDTGETFV